MFISTQYFIFMELFPSVIFGFEQHFQIWPRVVWFGGQLTALAETDVDYKMKPVLRILQTKVKEMLNLNAKMEGGNQDVDKYGSGGRLESGTL